MDINKEREDFEAWYEQHHNGRQISCDYVEEDNSYSVGYANAIWVGWQAAKATPEGFVLVPKVPSEEILPLNSLYEILDCQECCDAGGFCQERYIQIIEGISKAMIEAQEQSHDNSN